MGVGGSAADCILYVCMTVLHSHCGFVWCALQYHGGECPFVHQLHDCFGLYSILLRVVWCALQFHGGECPYNDEGLLMTTQACGLFECPPGCRGAGKGKTSLCRVRPWGGGQQCQVYVWCGQYQGAKGVAGAGLTYWLVLVWLVLHTLLCMPSSRKGKGSLCRVRPGGWGLRQCQVCGGWCWDCQVTSAKRRVMMNGQACCTGLTCVGAAASACPVASP